MCISLQADRGDIQHNASLEKEEVVVGGGTSQKTRGGLMFTHTHAHVAPAAAHSPSPAFLN